MATQMFKGSFTSTGASVLLPFVSGVDKIEVYNRTQLAASQTTAKGVSYLWFSTLPSGSKITRFKSQAADANNLDQYITSNGFTVYDNSSQQPGVLNATLSSISTAAIPVASNTGTNGLVAGDVVRFSRVATGQQLGGIDFTVGYNTLTSGTFSLDLMSQLTVQTGTGSWRRIPYNPIFYPSHRTITSITSSGTSTVVVTSVVPDYTVGQKVRLIVPAEFGMVEANNLIGTITAIGTTTAGSNTYNSSITLDIDSSSFTAFTFPTSSNNAFSQALVIPVGENTAVALANGLDILGDATVNTATKGLILQGGVNCPAGASLDEIVWVAYQTDSSDIDPVA
jgi:hypothetical protein